MTSYVVPSDEGPHRRYYGITERGRAQREEARAAGEEFERASTSCCSPRCSRSSIRSRRFPLKVAGARPQPPPGLTRDNRTVFHTFPVRYFEPGTRKVADPDAQPPDFKAPALAKPSP